MRIILRFEASYWDCAALTRRKPDFFQLTIKRSPQPETEGKYKVYEARATSPPKTELPALTRQPGGHTPANTTNARASGSGARCRQPVGEPHFSRRRGRPVDKRTAARRAPGSGRARSCASKDRGPAPSSQCRGRPGRDPRRQTRPEVRADGPDLQVSLTSPPRRTRRPSAWGRRARRSPGARPAFWAAAGPRGGVACCLRLVSCWGRGDGVTWGSAVGSTVVSAVGSAVDHTRAGERTGQDASSKGRWQKRVPSGGTTAQAICADSNPRRHDDRTFWRSWRCATV